MIKKFLKQKNKINSLEVKLETLENAIKDDLFNKFLDFIKEDVQIKKLKKQNENLKKQNNILKNKLLGEKKKCK